MEHQIDATLVPLLTGSRYRRTRLYKDTTMNQVYFGAWRPPIIREIRPVSYHIVVKDEIHRPDLISYRVYGRSDLWWAIAIRNNLLLPIIDTEAGHSLACPHLDDIMAALGSSGINTAGTT